MIVKSPMRDLAPEAVMGAMVGTALEMISLEGFSHQVLSHRTMEYPTWLDKSARLAMVLCGMSPNRFALEHRLHHQIEDTDSQDATGIVRHVLASGTGSDRALLDKGTSLFFDGLPDETDPLLVKSDDGLAFRNDSVLERLAGRADVGRFLPSLAATAALAVGNTLLGVRDQ
jgi:hypothetical protein